MLMAKSPVPGQVKTRFVPHVSAKTAAQIALEMLQDSVEKAVHHWPGVVQLLASPDANHPDLVELAKHYDLQIRVQSGGDLGQKMAQAIDTTLKNATAGAVMGCDIPDVTPAILTLAYNRLLEGHNVMGPSADGGFYFAGFTQFQSDVFDNVHWSTDTVFKIVSARLRACNLPAQVLLPCLSDIDHWSDFVELAKRHPRYAKFLA